MPHRLQQNVVVILHDAIKEVKALSPNHGAIERVLYDVKELLTEEDRNLDLPIAVKRKIKKMVLLTIEEPVEKKKKWYHFFCKSEPVVSINEYRLRLITLAMDIVVFIHSYK